MSVIQPDYCKGGGEVYFETATALLKDPRSAFYVLPFVYHVPQADVDGRAFPSWVPRWDRLRFSSTFNTPTYWAQAGGSGSFEAHVKGDKSLVAKGAIFDRILWVSNIITGFNLALDSNWWNKGIRSAQKPFFDILWESLVDAFDGLPGGLEIGGRRFFDKTNSAHFRRLCWTSPWHLGLVPDLAMPGDAYIDGAMKGDVLTELKHGIFKEEEEIIII